MAYLIYRVGRCLIPRELPDGTVLLQSPDDMPLEESAEAAFARFVELGKIPAPAPNEVLSMEDKIVAVGALLLSDPGDEDSSPPLDVPSIYWHWFLDLARSHGWQAEGTTYPLAFPNPEHWDGNYAVPAGQSISMSDTRQFCAALRRASRAFPFTEPYIFHRVGDDPKSILLDFISFCCGPYSLDIW